MSDTMYLSRAKLRDDASVGAIRALLMPSGAGKRMMAGHKVIWTLFADSPERTRDFLWREDSDGFYYLLSARPPEDRHQLFCLHPAKEFAPRLGIGDRLAFALRANATKALKIAGRDRGRPEDVVMRAIYHMPKGPERAEARKHAVEAAGLEWLTRQGDQRGFTVEPLQGGGPGARVMSYRALKPDPEVRQMTFGVIDFEGVLTVQDPDRFLQAVRTGFGRAKAFGCGLMLIKRA